METANATKEEMDALMLYALVDAIAPNWREDDGKRDAVRRYLIQQSIHLRCERQQASAWDEVCNTLDEVAPGWMQSKGTGQDLAVRDIRCLLAPITDGQINERTYDTLGQWPSFEAQARACKVVHAMRAQAVELAPKTVPEVIVDHYLDQILKASGSALKHYSMAKPKDDMRAALKAAVLAMSGHNNS